MKPVPFHLKPFGNRAVLLEWPAEVREEILFDLLGFADFLKFGDFPESEWEFIPIYHSLTLIRKAGDLHYAETHKALEAAYTRYPGPTDTVGQHWELPVHYDPEFGPDLETAAQAAGMDVDGLIRAHTAQAYRVYGIGFLPGFLYLGGVPELLQIPRKATPRLRVPKGSVGLAAQQTGIYPQESPGGWNLIGNCPIPLFNPGQSPPCFISLGDTVGFRSVSRSEFDLHRIEGEVGVYDFKKKYGNAKD
ncbi:5-oxoprolinase subunit PxpB [Robiginitalea sp. M366]|uniref:5-oxoprolinase subunit PxpB n=1 Tax=Robiginitalea aestuariiviva TaxID=3036903 RepID=UPI00240DD5C1|nr:5-oxoprolinase subunit PxpB [Robiginitalea aestuariiviva]MDG1572833.1 5-oxoprolinase subunit PxpB [Robiginitalea aestuariiviva]